MIIVLLIGIAMMVLNLGILVLALAFVVRMLTNRIDSAGEQPSLWDDVRVLSLVMGVLTAGHLLQFATWAALFNALGEFTDFLTAFYHSAVNFTSLGYGDIVMSERWRLLGALEAANGVLMFGLSASTILAVMNALFSRHKAMTEFRNSLSERR
jgi:voltage-gated potassium channel Kch